VIYLRKDYIWFKNTFELDLTPFSGRVSFIFPQLLFSGCLWALALDAYGLLPWIFRPTNKSTVKAVVAPAEANRPSPKSPEIAACSRLGGRERSRSQYRSAARKGRAGSRDAPVPLRDCRWPMIHLAPLFHCPSAGAWPSGRIALGAVTTTAFRYE
jgi:hypothetical protein